jgi:hypothetical protein
MDNLDHRHSLLRLARRDFDALLGMQGSALFADAIFAFHAQQAVEKALKAWFDRAATPPLPCQLAMVAAYLAGTTRPREILHPGPAFSAPEILSVLVGLLLPPGRHQYRQSVDGRTLRHRLLS